MSNGEIRWSTPSADAYILTATGNPYGNPPDIAAYLYYVLGKRGLQEACLRGTRDEIHCIHLILCAKILDGSLRQVSDEMLNLFSFAARKIAEKLSQVTGQNWIVYKSSPVEATA
jgi:hypothetical protein